MKSLVTILVVIYSLRLPAQDANTEVQHAIDQFMNANNPVAALKLLRETEDKIPLVADSLAANYYVSVGICHGQMGNADSSFFFLDKAEQIGTRSGLDLIIVKVNSTRGLVYMGMANYEESLAAYYRAIELAEGKADPRMQESVRKIYGNAGGIHYQLGDYSKAIDLTKKALRLSQELKDNAGMAYNHLRLALVYNDIDSLNKGIENLNKSVQYFEDLGDTITLIYAENTLGRVLEKQSDYDAAFIQYKAAYDLAREIGGAQEEVAFTLLSMAAVKLKLGQPDLAGLYARQAKEFSMKNNYYNSLKRSYDLLHKSEKNQGNYRKALSYLDQYLILSDSLNGIEVKERVAELETKYETAKKEAEIERLSLENDLQNANLARSRNAQFAIGIGAGMGLILLIVYFTQRNKKMKAQQEAQDLQIEALQKRLMDLNISPSEPKVKADQLNEKINTPLSEREFEVLKLTLEGMSNNEIAETLFVSTSTVKFHLRNTYSKLGVNNRKEALDYVVKTS